MNLFCFSLEGSTDSLYEPALNKHPVIQEHSCRVPSRHNSRHSSPALRDRAKWRGSDPCIPTELSEAHKSHLKKKKRRSHVPTTSTSDNETIDNTDTNVYWQSLREKQDFVHIKNNHKEEMGQGPCQRSVLVVEDRVEQLNSERREKEPTTQGVNFEAWNPNYEPPDSHQQNMVTWQTLCSVTTVPSSPASGWGRRQRRSPRRLTHHRHRSSRLRRPMGKLWKDLGALGFTTTTGASQNSLHPGMSPTTPVTGPQTSPGTMALTSPCPEQQLGTTLRVWSRNWTANRRRQCSHTNGSSARSQIWTSQNPRAPPALADLTHSDTNQPQ
ncbi:SAM domain-containing protein SAMSN-1b isoform X3 [Oncorhynchus tshawytscha]|uniref:SAM domain-containing protein SAMSN-1b isoform X3 n=1 Tax=Oncorhynchus tshawytscha TaxID=74940 RepID=UPI001C3D69C6|nr:SAM domain-containing protein SAMSN-1b isoform X3 [Oncorhynchus tshawytscha]